MLANRPYTQLFLVAHHDVPRFDAAGYEARRKQYADSLAKARASFAAYLDSKQQRKVAA